MNRAICAAVIAAAMLALVGRLATPAEPIRGFGLVKKVPAADEEPSGGVSRALLIGNDEYQAKTWPKLTTAVRDVDALAEVLMQRYGYAQDHIQIIRNGTRRQILRGFLELIDQARPEDSVLIYYGGHGEFDKNGRGWWVPVDSLERVDYISNEDILANLRNIKVRHKLLIADSCFSGNLLTRGAASVPAVDAPPSGYFQEKSKLISVQGFSSGGNEPVSDGGPEWNGHSVFAYHLIAALKANQKTYLSASLLGTQVTEVVANDTATMKGVGQTPVVSSIKNQGDQGGEFFFVPTDIAVRAMINVLVFNSAPEVVGVKVKLEKAQEYIDRAVMEQMQKQMLMPLGEVQTLRGNNVEAELAARLKGSKAKGAIVVALAGQTKREATMFWQGLSRLQLHLESYRFANDRLVKVGSHDVAAQQFPMRTWSEDPAALEDHYLKNAEKVVEKWSRPQLNEFLVQFDEQNR